ncbi:MAG TPA: sensor domain-containing diguanylate cyclase [Polyangiaceae bacterium]|nr:sensor domain-containing diguanylate cyclase [Polyangiaceae bacterium]
MEALVRASVALRRAARRGLAVATIAGLSGLLVADTVAPFAHPVLLLSGLCWAAVLTWCCVRRFRAKEADSWSDFELGALGVVATYGLLARAGGLAGPLYPVIYVLVAVVCTFARPVPAALVLAMLLLLEGSIRYAALAELALAPLLIHAAFLATFAVQNLVFLRIEVARIRVRGRARFEAELVRVRDAARSYRLLGSLEGPSSRVPARSGEDERLARSSVEEIHQAVLFALDLLRQSLGLHTALLVWQNEAGTHARISELSSAADDVAEGPFLSGDGVIGAVLVRRASVVLDGLKPSYKLPYYKGPCPVRTVCGVPVMEHGQPRGVLLVDRVDDRRFSPVDEQTLDFAARYMARAIQNERVFVQLERAKVEQGKLYRAAEALGAALTEADVLEAGVKSAREVALFDFAAVTLFDPAAKSHEVRAVSGEGCEALLGAHFPHNASLCSMVVQNRHALPYKGEFDPAHQVLFAKKLHAPAMPSMLVLPLLVHERALGTLVLGAKRKSAFGDAVRPTLEVLARHMAVSLANARMVKTLEGLATTDGLTGLLNKRAMLDIASDKVAAAVRFARHLSVLVVDIDFFKNVNDLHGHDVGDLVIQGLGEILRRAKRTTDAVARFGGEEFVVICEETDAKGAMLLAERVRKEVEGRVFATQSGPLKVTCSVGAATFPEAGRDWEALFKAADAALYASKRGGRNRSTAWGTLRKTSAA